ncbi:MAG: Peptidase M16 inactive domain protein [Betaproteobacteria bacterium ADurb.Bin341]|nr:MAG: Peptidase M16 inactive domain protein [Betaproteobacteria bacterium ADurb.Bin341]
MFRTVLFLWALLSAWSAIAGVRIEHWVSTSGARVYFAEAQALPILDVQVDFAAGSMFDPPGKSGLAGLTRSVLDLGAGGLDENAIADRLADVGAHLGGGADTDRASVSLRTLTDEDKMEAALGVMQTVLQSPRFDKSVFARERARTIASLKEALTRPEGIAGRALWQAMYPAHAYGRQATPETLAGLAVDDARTFYRRFYNARNATITLVGKISRAEAEAIAERLAVALPPGQPAELPAPPLAPPELVRKIGHPASQSHIHLGVPAIERGHPDFFPLLVGNYSLGGGGFVSRLMKEVRERRGYAYSVYSYFAPLRQAGPFQIGLQTKRAQAGDALALTRSILREFIRSGPSEKELAAAKANLTGSFPLRLDSNRKILDNVAVIGFYGLPLDYLDTYRQKVSEVTAEQIRAAFARHVRQEHLVTIMVAAD